MDDRKEAQSFSDEGMERVLAEAMKELQVMPSEELKGKSFQQALKGVKQARKVAERRRKMKRMRDWLILVAATVAALFLVFQFVLPDDTPPEQTAQGPEEREPNGVEEGDIIEEGKDREQAEQPTQKGEPANEEGEQEVNRPPLKTIATYPEGTKEEVDYVLYADEIFSTYIFPEWKAERGSRSWKDGNGLTVVRIEPKNEEHTYGEMEIIFFPASADGQEVEEYVKTHYVQNNPYDIYPPAEGSKAEWSDWEIRPWAQKTYRYKKDDGELGRKGYVRLGQYDGRWFAVWEESGMLAEAWPHRASVVYDEWIWTKTEEPLEKQ